MPSIDGGYYFLTVLVPVCRASREGQAQAETAPLISLRKKLAQMPTALQTPWSHNTGKISKFSKSTRTHFARFAVIDRLGYNGYKAADPILETVGLAKPADSRSELASPYLLFAAEFDAPSGSKDYDLAVYLRELWDVMEDDLVEIFSNCVDFDPKKIDTAAEFINYIKKCEIETTMPFNWYWAEPPQLPDRTVNGMLWTTGVGALVACVATAWGLKHFIEWLPLWLAVLVGALVAVLLAVFYVGNRLKTLGDPPFPAPPDGSLISVLKGLHLQKTMGAFVIEHQADDPADLHKAFGDYLKENKVSEPTPRHPAGEVYR